MVFAAALDMVLYIAVRVAMPLTSWPASDAKPAIAAVMLSRSAISEVGREVASKIWVLELPDLSLFYGVQAPQMLKGQ